MPVSIVVGGQFGSEGKGKVALEVVRRSTSPAVVIRVGGPNSGHTAYDRSGRRWALRQMPAGAVDRGVDVVFPAGSYIDPPLLRLEIEQLGYPKERVRISRFAHLITEQHREWERTGGLTASIGSTGSGVGAAVLASVARGAPNLDLLSPRAEEHPWLEPYLCDVPHFLRQRLDQGHRVVIEGTQGFGLSLLEGGYWPKATARSTTAAGALAEAGLSPLDVDEVLLVLRAHPIRVAGDSGPLLGETTWDEIARSAGIENSISEYTTVTGQLRRVGIFDPNLVRRAISVNSPNRIVMNHLDYIGPEETLSNTISRLSTFIRDIEMKIGRKVDMLGFSPASLVEQKAVA